MKLPDTLKYYLYSASSDELSRIWTWQLRRQGLGTDAKLDSIVQIADRSLGLHAARLPSPVTTVMVRSASPEVAGALFDATQPRRLTTVRCMRRTLHTLPLPLAAISHGATVHFRERDALRRALNTGASRKAIEAAGEAILHVVEDEGLLSHRDIEERVANANLSTHTVRAALKLIWERGVLTYYNRAPGWNAEYRTFGLTSRLHPELDMNLSRDRATKDLVFHYFDRYGPATIGDMSWWSGIGSTNIATAMSQNPAEWVALRTPWSDNLAFMTASRLDEFHRQAVDASRSEDIEFLAHEDVALKAYFETRKRYLGEYPQTKAFNQIGEVLPSIIYDGLIVGRWDWNYKAEVIEVNLFREIPGAGHVIKGLQQNYTDVLRQLLCSRTRRTLLAREF